MFVVVTKGVKNSFDVALVVIADLEVRMLVCLLIRNKLYHFATSVFNELICSNRLMFVMYLGMLLLLMAIRRILMLF